MKHPCAMFGFVLANSQGFDGGAITVFQNAPAQALASIWPAVPFHAAPSTLNTIASPARCSETAI